MNQQPMLLLLQRKRTVYAFNPIGLTLAQSPQGKLRREYVGEHLLDQEGVLYAIKDATVLGYYGATIGRKLLSIFSGAYSIRTELEEIARPSIEELKTLTIRFVRYDAESPDPLLTEKVPVETVVQLIEQAKSPADIFVALDMPTLENCLDVL